MSDGILLKNLLPLLRAGRPVDEKTAGGRDRNDGKDDVFAPLPKFAYPSGGSLYAVQTYLVSDGKAHYYNPLRNSLQTIPEKAVEESVQTAGRDSAVPFPAFLGVPSLIFVGNTACVEPLYPEGGEYFVGIEAGCMMEVLNKGVPDGIELNARPIEQANETSALTKILQLPEGSKPLFQITIGK